MRVSNRIIPPSEMRLEDLVRLAQRVVHGAAWAGSAWLATYMLINCYCNPPDKKVRCLMSTICWYALFTYLVGHYESPQDHAEPGLALPGLQHTCLRGGEGTVDRDVVASNCSTGSCSSNVNKRINSKSSNWEIGARWGFPTVSSPLPNVHKLLLFVWLQVSLSLLLISLLLLVLVTVSCEQIAGKKHEKKQHKLKVKQNKENKQKSMSLFI